VLAYYQNKSYHEHFYSEFEGPVGWDDIIRFVQQKYNVKVRDSRNRPGVAQRIPGVLGS
jgi:hypothetical protein